MDTFKATPFNSQCYMSDMLDMSADRDEEISELEGKDTGVSEVTEFFNGLNVLVTGGTGFLGKLMIEKLLRTCPDMGKLYMLMRPKKGKTSEERFKEEFNDAVYERLHKEVPDFLNKIELIEGDTSKDDLAMTAENREKLVENVNVVLNGAATVRFDESLRKAVDINVRGPRAMMKLAKEIKHLKAMVHISTAFSHCVRSEIDEKFYEPPMDPEKALALVDMLSDDVLKHMTAKLLGNIPNTYAFSKALGEEVVRRASPGLPICVVRPSIMIATAKEPVAGWINNFYGPTGVVMGAGIGLLRSMHCNAEKIADIIPADYVVNTILVAAYDCAKSWEEEHRKDPEKVENKEPLIYNAVSSCQKPIDWGTFTSANEKFAMKVPSDKILWYYMFMLNSSLWFHNVCCFLLHTVPACLVDCLAIMTGREPQLGKAYKKIHKFSHVISYFSTQQWLFHNRNVMALWKRTSPVDRNKFYFNIENLDWMDYFYHHVRGLRKYILEDPIETVENGKKRFFRLKVAHYTLVTIISTLFFYAVYRLFDTMYSWLPNFD
ncbi:hypothetical protein TKK_0009068 [Trichogramma kaykai]|uniref:Fatty acyl-CoA reductase n=1 Tax=Trichogramma kaykai TaxID=54128 RepID=A0ABD2X3L9_9HYME